MDINASDQPGEVNAEQGEVLLDGANGLACAFTPEAAEETSLRLHAGAIAADAQRRHRAAPSGN